MTTLIPLIFFAAILGFIPAVIASSKGYKFFGWWIYGALLFIVAFIHAILISPVGSRRTCPFCAEKIKSAAIVCPHCQRDIPAPATSAAA